MTWEARGGTCKLNRYHVHESGFEVRHCGHPTALWPYHVLDPTGRWVGAFYKPSRKGRPRGLTFRRLAEAKAWVERHLHRTVELVDGAAVRGWALVLPPDWPFDWPKLPGGACA